MDDIYSECIASLMPDVSLAAALENVQFLTHEELTTQASPMWKYPKMVSRFIAGSHMATCSRFHLFNWDRHFKEKLNYLVNSTPLQVFDKRVYTAKKLVWLGWAVLAIYPLDKRNEQFLGLIVGKLTKLQMTKESVQFIEKLCAKNHELQLPLSLFEDLVTASPTYIEKLIIDLISSVHSEPEETCRVFITEILFQRADVISWLNSCARSPKVFQISSNVINTMMLNSQGSPMTRMFLQVFLSSVRGLLAVDTNIEVLYPAELQPLVKYMNLRPGFAYMMLLNSEDAMAQAVLEPLMNGLAHNRRMYSCLLSHFPPWIPLLFKYAIANGEAKVFSKKFLETDNLSQFKRLEISKAIHKRCEVFISQ